MQLLSLVIPCFNEEAVLDATMQRLTEFRDDVDHLQLEFIFVDDGSGDRTAEIIKNFAHVDHDVRLISFARNFGHQVAVTAGIDAARGDAVVLIDADLQDPPEAIHDMIVKWREGYDVVYGTRVDRPGESAFKLATAHSFYRFLNFLSDVPIPVDTGDFRLMSRHVVDTLRAMPERGRFVRGMVTWTGFNQIALPYKRAERFAGTTKYSIRKMVAFAMDGILSFSAKPLQLSILLGSASSLLALLGIIYALVMRIFTANWVPGWTALIIAFLFIGGMQLICLGFVGLYVGRIYEESKARPLYVAKEYVGFDSAGPFMSRSPIVIRQ